MLCLVAGSGLFLVKGEGDPLDLEARRRIYQHLQAYPGLHLSEIARGVEMETNHAKYHLRVLAEHGLVSRKEEDGYVRFYPREDKGVAKGEILQPIEKEWLSLLRRRIPMQMTLVLLDEGSCNAGQMRKALDIAGSTLHYHASKMEDAGLLESHKEGRQRIYELHDPERVEELVRKHEPPDELVKGFLEGWSGLEFP